MTEDSESQKILTVYVPSRGTRVLGVVGVASLVTGFALMRPDQAFKGMLTEDPYQTTIRTFEREGLTEMREDGRNGRYGPEIADAYQSDDARRDQALPDSFMPGVGLALSGLGTVGLACVRSLRKSR